jgi:hypothetical protein
MKDAGVSRALAWTAALREPHLALAWTPAEWDRVVRLARRLRLLARLAEALAAGGLLDAVPDGPRRHLVADRRVSRLRIAAMCWAIERIGAATADIAAPKLLLKGAAYVGQGLPNAAGRLPSDLDILVPREFLGAVRARLAEVGWRETALDAHDRRYYEEWSHELPPMRHALHTIELDLHHDIVAPVARDAVDVASLIALRRPSGLPGWSVFDPADQVLHSAAHLFLDSELRDRVRDLVDIDSLLRHFSAGEPGFADRLAARACKLGLARPLALAFDLCGDWLGTPVPAEARARLPTATAALRACFAAVLRPVEPGARTTPAARAAAWLLLLRHHHRRLPLRLLVPHVWHKVRGAGRDEASG